MTTAYIGVKIVAAWPEQKSGVDGYAVKYPDGYTSWSPKGTFEACYREITREELGLAQTYLAGPR